MTRYAYNISRQSHYCFKIKIVLSSNENVGIHGPVALSKCAARGIPFASIIEKHVHSKFRKNAFFRPFMGLSYSAMADSAIPLLIVQIGHTGMNFWECA